VNIAKLPRVRFAACGYTLYGCIHQLELLAFYQQISKSCGGGFFQVTAPKAISSGTVPPRPATFDCGSDEHAQSPSDHRDFGKPRPASARAVGFQVWSLPDASPASRTQGGDHAA
jgi:hypothetical protein